MQTTLQSARFHGGASLASQRLAAQQPSPSRVRLGRTRRCRDMPVYLARARLAATSCFFFFRFLHGGPRGAARAAVASCFRQQSRKSTTKEVVEPGAIQRPVENAADRMDERI